MASDWRDEFVRLLSSPRQDDWEKAQALRLEHIPKALYRYRRATEHALQNLVRGTVWLSQANRFNDLYDTSVVFDAVVGMNKQPRDALLDAISRLPPGSDLPAGMVARLMEAEDRVAALAHEFAQVIEERDGPKMAERAKDFFTKFLTQRSTEQTAKMTEFMQRATKVCCFCELGTSPRLWGYYSNNEGFCVESPYRA